MTETEIRDMYTRYADALNARELDKVRDLIDDNVVLNGQPAMRETVLAAIGRNIDAVPDMRWELRELLIDHDRLAVRAVNTGTPVKEWLGVAHTGASFTLAEVAIYKVEGGRFTEMSFVHDSASLLRQLHP